jgi:hypothetical protein
MSTIEAQRGHGAEQEVDAVESVVPVIPLVLPVVGGLLIFLLAFIAVYVA